MSNPFLAEIRIFGFNFAPHGWAFCAGQTLAISQNTALFSLLGTTYGGNGTSSFALPDLRGRGALHSGQGPGLSNYVLGQFGGTENVTLLTSEIPQHSHALAASSSLATVSTPASDTTLARSSGGLLAYDGTATPGTALSPQAVSVSGGSQPHNNLMPYLAVNFCIAMSGIFPARN